MRTWQIDEHGLLGRRQTMKDGPDIAKTAAMMGDPARANMLMALMSGMSHDTKIPIAAEMGRAAT